MDQAGQQVSALHPDRYSRRSVNFPGLAAPILLAPVPLPATFFAYETGGEPLLK